MPDYAIEVDVEPDGSGFPAELARVVSRAEERQDPIEIEVSPKLTRDFVAQVRAQTRKALERIEAQVQVQAKLDRGFRAQLQREIRTATAGVTAPVDVEAKVGPRFRRDLQREILRAAAGLNVEIEAQAKVGRAFRRDLQRDLRRTTEGLKVEVPIEPVLPRRARRDLQRSLSTAMGGRPLEVPVALTVNARALARLRAALAAGIDVRVGADTSAAQREIAGLSALGTRVGGAFGAAFRLAFLGALVGLGVLVVGAIAGPAIAAAGFEKELSSLRATADLTAESLGVLREQALEAGRDTAFSAREAATAQTELAKAGASVEQILGGGLDAALALAAAGEIELAEAAGFVAKGLNTFNLEAGESGRVADALAAAANRSATDIPQMGSALQQAGLVASQFNLTVEETAGTLALFAQNGLVGSDAGTSFRTMLQRLNPQSEEAADLMASLGLQFYDAEGRFVGIEAAAGDLRSALVGLTEEQRAAAIQTIFGTDAARAANIVYEAGGAGIAEWTAQVTDSGNAAETAAIKMDNLSGDLERLKGTFETILIEGSGTEGFRDIVQGLDQTLQEVGPELSAALVPFASILSVLAPLLFQVTGALGPLFQSIFGLVAPFTVLVQGPLAQFMALLPSVADALAPVVGALGYLLRALQPVLPFLSAVIEVLAAALAPAVAGLASGIAPLVSALAGGLLPILDELAPVAATLGTILGDLLATIGTELAPVIAEAFEENRDLLPELTVALTDLAMATAELLVAVLPLIVPLARFMTLFTRAQIIGITLFAQNVAWLVDHALAPLIGVLSRFIAGNYERAFDWLEPVLEPLTRLNASDITEFFQDVGGAISAFFGNIPGWANTAWDTVYRNTTRFFSLLPGWVVGGLDAAWDEIYDWVAGVAGRSTDLAAGLLSWVTDAVAALPGLLWGLVSAVADWYLDAAVQVPGIVAGLAADLLSWVISAVVSMPFLLADMYLTLASWVVEFGPQVATAVAGLAVFLSSWISNAVYELPFQLAGLYWGVVTWAIETYPEIASAVAGLAGAALSWVWSAIVALPGLLATLTSTLWGWATGLAGLVAGAAGDVFGFLGRQAGNAIDSAVDFIAALPGRILGFVGWVAAAAAGIGGAIFDGIVAGLSAAGGMAADLVSAIGRGLTDFINEHIIDAINRGIPDEIGRDPFKIDLPNDPLPHLARGGLIERPTLALVGEAGPELVLPLSDPERVRELLAEHMAGIASVTSGAAATAINASMPEGAAAEPAWAPGTEGLETWVEDVVLLMVGLGTRLQEEAMPTALEWEVQMVDLLTRLDLTHQTTLDQMVLATQDSTALLVATWAMAGAQMVAVVQATSAGQVAALQGGLNDMAMRAALGGAGIVAALQLALSSGTAVVKVIVVGYRGELVGALNPILEAVGSPTIALARGGYVPGPDVRADIIDAKLMPREYVLTRDMTEEMGVAELEAWRRRSLRGLRTVPRFAEGGPVIGDTVGLNPEFHRRLDTWAVAQNAVYRVDSGYRDMAEQARLYQAYLAGVPGQAPAAPPGSSMHNFGLAADGSRWRDRNPGAFGLRYPMSYEPWHVEPVEARQWAALMPDGGAIFSPLPQPPEAGGKGLLSLVAGELMAHAYDQALEWAGSVAYGSAPGDLALGGSGPAREAMARLWIAEAVRLTGVPTSWIPGLLTIARRESGFDPTAINLWDSNAAKGQASQGLMQTIPATFMRYALPGLGQILNPVHNAVAAIRYIMARYGDISNVQQANPAAPPKGYAQGGMVLPDGTASAMAAFDTAAMSAQLQAPPPPPVPGGAGVGRDGGMTFEDGSVRIEVKAPDAHDPEAYAMSLGHRAPVLLAKALRRAGVG